MSTAINFNNHNKTAYILLAAGSSKRFGGDKRQYILDGKQLIQHSLEKPLSLGLPTVLVLKPEDQQVFSELEKANRHNGNLYACYSTTAHLGMGHSISSAIHFLEAFDIEFEAALIALADMPWLKISTLQLLLDHYKTNKIIAPFIRRKDNTCQQGNPVLFSKYWFPELKALQGDTGAKQLISNNPDLIRVIIEDEGILNDIDCIDDILTQTQSKKL